MKLLIIITLVLVSQLGFSQTNDTSTNKSLLKELGENACKCIDSISVNNKPQAKVIEEVSKCINNQTGAYHVGSKIMNIDALKKDAPEKNGIKEINISINMNEESDEYKKYYFEMERYLMDNCKSLKDKIASHNNQNEKSFSQNQEALDLYDNGLDEGKKGDYKKAIYYYEQAVKIDPNFVFAWDNLGICYRRLENYDKSLEAYETSLKINPKGLMPLQNIPVVYIYKKEYNKAILAYQKLAEVDKNNPEVFYGIGNTYANALFEYEKGLSYLCKAYNLYIEQKSPYRADAEKLINIIFQEMKKQGKEARFSEILKENNIRTE